MKKQLALLATLTALVAAPAFANSEKFDKMDTDGDGMISMEEHQAAGKSDKMFKAADTDGDGMVSKDEAMAYHAKNKGKASKTKHGIGHRGTAADDHEASRDANPHPTKDKQDQDM